MIAGELAAAGKSVCVLEMGGYYDDRDFDQLELAAYQRLYLNGGPFPTADGQVSIVAGTGVGGGTVVNWTNCLRTHDWVREEWAREHGLEGLDGPEFDAHLDAVSERIQVNGDCSDLNGPAPAARGRLRDARLRLPARSCATPTASATTRRSAAYMGFGDQSGSKQSTAKTYLVDAQARRRRDPRRLSRRADPGRGRPRRRGRGRLRRSRARRQRRRADPGRSVRAPTVVVACGAIESPALLLRSGIGGPAVGDFLRLHPTAAVTAYYDEPQNWCWGPPQAALSHEFADIGDGHGFLIEARAVDDRPVRRRRAVALGSRPQAADEATGRARRR